MTTGFYDGAYPVPASFSNGPPDSTSTIPLLPHQYPHPHPPAYPHAPPAYAPPPPAAPPGASYPTAAPFPQPVAFHQAAYSNPQPPTQWSVPPSGAIHLAAGLPDEMLPKHFGSGSELVKVTGKSCASCRTRKVKCDRRYPECTRCVKRKEPCDYGADVSLALRPVVVGSQARDEDSYDTVSSTPRHSPFSTIASPHQRIPTSSMVGLPYPPRTPLEAQTPRSLRTISDFRHQLARRNGFPGTVDDVEEEEDGVGEQKRQGFQELWDRFLHQSNLGESSSDWRLALPSMASSLTVHLLDASMDSCCFHLPAFNIFNPQIASWKQNIESLDLASRVAVSVLTSLGARASPHSALLGVAGPDIENGRASHELVLSAGIRRENAWRAIVKQATDLGSKLEIIQVPSVINAQTLVAIVQMLMFAEVKPKTARYFLRAAIGLFYDMQRGGVPQNDVEVIKQSVGLTLYESDARIAAWLSMPVLISEDDLFEYFEGTGVHLVDLEQEDLGDQLDVLFNPASGPISLDKTAQALRITGSYVCAVQRLFAKISSSRRPANRFLDAIQDLWKYIDAAHGACQRLTGALRDFAMSQQDPHHPANHELLIGLRMHERLLDVMNLSNEWLRSKRHDVLSTEDRTALEALLGVSNRRVRRCLKVLAFYAKIFHDSHDKHVVYHLFTQLEAVQGWATMVVQRENEVDEFGPIAEQCVLTETELDYFQQALELACFYTPLPSKRLQEFTRARNARGPRQSQYISLADYDSQSLFPISVPAFAHEAAQGQFPYASNDLPTDRFTELDGPPRIPLSPSTARAGLGRYAQTQVNPKGAADPGSLSSWLLSGFADNSADASPATTASASPSTSSPSVSPAVMVEHSSSPSTTSSHLGSAPNLYPSRRPSFALSSLSTSFVPPPSSTTYDLPVGGQLARDVTFPPSTVSNLSSNFAHAYGGFPIPVQASVPGSGSTSHGTTSPSGGVGSGSSDESNATRSTAPPAPLRDFGFVPGQKGQPAPGENGHDAQWSSYPSWTMPSQTA
ncbi:hypothetical protein JCM10212_001278 [Sporobolomyces blumeae]